jgi:hypothetical protein
VCICKIKRSKTAYLRTTTAAIGIPIVLPQAQHSPISMPLAAIFKIKLFFSENDCFKKNKNEAEQCIYANLPQSGALNAQASIFLAAKSAYTAVGRNQNQTSISKFNIFNFPKWTQSPPNEAL